MKSKPKINAIAERMFREIMDSVDKNRTKAAARLSRKLGRTFRGVCPDMNPELTGRVIARLVDIVDHSDELKEDVRKVTRLTRRSDALRLRSVLNDMQLLRLENLQRYNAGLLRDIPRVLSTLETRKLGKGRQSKPKGRFDKLTEMLDELSFKPVRRSGKRKVG